MPELRLLCRHEMEFAAGQHRRAGALIPGYDPTQRSPDETVAAYLQAFDHGAVAWGAFDASAMVGHMMLAPGWIEHLYVEPERHGQGVGRALLDRAQAEQDDLQLYSYQANVRARRMYEAAGFRVEEFGLDPNHSEHAPNVRYRWRRAPA